MKTRFLTEDSTRIDLTACQIRGFSFRKFKDDCWHLRIDFFLFSQQNLIVKHSLDVEMSLEAKGSKIL